MKSAATELKLSDTLSLPIDAATQTFAFLGRKSSGKTYGAGKLVELLLEAGVQVVILDTVGNWYGLRLAADGKSKGFDIPVIGGSRGDIPLEEGAGALIANTLADTGRSAVLDVSQFSKAARQRFATAFGEQLWQRKKADTHPSPMMLVIEECQLIIPQDVQGDQKRMVGIYEEIVRLGRNYGIGAIMLSQRPQSVNKEVLNQTECLLVFQTSGSHERDALKKWVVDQGGSIDSVRELPFLPTGIAYVWSPQWLQIFERVQIAKKKTYDSSATPKVGDKRAAARKLTPLDLDDLKQQMQDVVARAKADDPKELRKRIAELEKALLAAKNAAPPSPERIEVPILPDKTRAQMEALIRQSEQLQNEMQKVLAKYAPQGKGVPVGRQDSAIVLKKPPPRAPQAASMARVRTNGRATATDHANEEVGSGGLRRILTALAQRPAGLSKRQIGVRAGLSSTSGTFSTYLSRARSQGWIEGSSSLLAITAVGLEALGAYEHLPAGAALLEHWVAELGQGGASRLLRAVAEAYPNAISKAEAAETAGLTGSSGTVSTYLSRLRGLELVHGRGELKASAELFE